MVIVGDDLVTVLDEFVFSACLEVRKMVADLSVTPPSRNKVITTMVIRPLDDRTCCVRSVFINLLGPLAKAVFSNVLIFVIFR